MGDSPFHSSSSPPATKMSRPEAVRLMQRAVNPGSGMGNSTARGDKSARSGSNTARGKKGKSDHMFLLTTTSSPGSPSKSGGPMKVADSVTLLQLRREYDERLEKERQAIHDREVELEEKLRREEKRAHRDAVAETALGLSKLRQQQQAKLEAHNKMHQTAEADKIAAAARAVQIATQHGLDMQAMREKTRLEAEARFAIEVKQLNERHNEAMLRQAENLNAAAERKLNIEKEATHAVTVRAEKLQQELELEQSRVKDLIRQVESEKKDKEKQLREQKSKDLAEKNAAIQAEKDKAETARQTAAKAEAVRAEVVKLRSQEADRVTALATQALKVAEKEKEEARLTWKAAEAQRAEHAKARAEMELMRDESKAMVENAKKKIADADERIKSMEYAMSLQQAALDAVRNSAEAEKLALMKAAEEAKAAALHAVAMERAAEKAEAEVARAKRLKAAEQARKLGASAAYIPPGDDDEDAALLQLSKPASSMSTAIAGAGSIMSAENLEAMANQVKEAIEMAEREQQHAAAAEERVAELEKEIDVLQTLVGGSSKKALEVQKEKLTRQTDIARGLALRQLREAEQIKVSGMAEELAGRSLAIVGCQVIEEMLHRDDSAAATAIRSVPQTMQVGIVCGVHIPAALAETAGFGDDRGSAVPEPVHVLIHSSDGESTPVTGVAVAVAHAEGTLQEWLVKFVVEDDQVPAPAWLGEHAITIASRWGVIVAQGRALIEERNQGVAASKRYELNDFDSAATKLQARARGRTMREKPRPAPMRREKAKAVSAIDPNRPLNAPNVGDIAIIATNKPLICRAGNEFSFTSEQVGQLEPDTRVQVIEIVVMPDGQERAQVQLEGASEPFGWLTMVKEGSSSLQRVMEQLVEGLE